MEQFIEWSTYFTKEEYESMISFMLKIKNIKEDLPMIVFCGSNIDRKLIVLKQIIEYIGTDKCKKYSKAIGNIYQDIHSYYYDHEYEIKMANKYPLLIYYNDDDAYADY